MVDLDDSRPSYQQVASRLRDAIGSGQLAVGEQLPTHKALADRYGVAVETIKRALGELRAAGLVVTRQGKGSYVRSPAERDRPGAPVDVNPNVVEALAELRRDVADLARRIEAVERQLNDHQGTGVAEVG